MVLCNGNYTTLSDNDRNGALQVQNLTWLLLALK